MNYIKIRELAFFTKYSFDERLILLVVISLFLPLHFAAVPVVLIAGFVLCNKERRQRVIQVPFSWCVAGIFLVSLLSCLIFRNWLGLAATVLLILIAVFSLYARSIMSFSFFTNILNIIIGLSIIPAALGAMQKLYFLHILKPQGAALPFDGRVYSVFANPNYYAYIIDLILIIIVYRLLNIKKGTQKHRKFFYYTVLSLNVVALILTNCRSSLISLLLGIVILTVSHKKFAAAVILFFLYLAYLLLIETFPDIFPRMDFLYLDNSMSARIDIWKGAWLGIKESPLIGQGTLGYKLLVPRFDIPDKHHAHNILIDLILNYGIIGTSLFAAYFLRCVIGAKKYLKSAAGKSLCVFLLSVLIITLAHGITDVTVLGVQTGILFALLIAGFGISFSQDEDI